MADYTQGGCDGVGCDGCSSECTPEPTEDEDLTAPIPAGETMADIVDGGLR